MVLHQAQNLCSPQIPCGSELAPGGDPTMLFKGLCAPHQCTANRNCACTTSQNQSIQFEKNRTNKNKSPGIRGFQHRQQCFCDKPFKTGTPPAITQSLPSFGDLGTGRPGIPLFYTGLIEPTVLGALIQAGQGFPSLHQGWTFAVSPPVLGTLVQAGRGFPLLLLLEMDLQPPAVIDLAGGPRPAQRTRRHQRQQQPLVTQPHPPVHVLAVEL
ncbi:hypothetical protein SAMN04490180_5037 [Pseudomonas brassicacearum]|nr:hypothetical protein SAMN04490180_5037 [Pseudomonas brassicacearum]